MGGKTSFGIEIHGETALQPRIDRRRLEYNPISTVETLWIYAFIELPYAKGKDTQGFFVFLFADF